MFLWFLNKQIQVRVNKDYNSVLKWSYWWFVHYIYVCHWLFSLVVIPSFSVLSGYRKPHVALGDDALCWTARVSPVGCWIVHLRQLGGKITIYVLTGLSRVLELTPNRLILNVFPVFLLMTLTLLVSTSTYNSILLCIQCCSTAIFRHINKSYGNKVAVETLEMYVDTYTCRFSYTYTYALLFTSIINTSSPNTPSCKQENRISCRFQIFDQTSISQKHDLKSKTHESRGSWLLLSWMWTVVQAGTWLYPLWFTDLF